MVEGARRAVFRLGAPGIAGSAAFTGAWIANSLRQTRQGPGGLQLSGLAAPGARDPQIMLADLLVLGGPECHGRRGTGPALVQGAGSLTVAAGPAAPRSHAAQRAR